MGKRFHAQYFIDSAWHETHSCNYLLATDIEMETVPGYKATSWEAGYGDYTMKPDLSTLRRIPWLEGTAMVICDVLDHHTHEEVPHSPRAILKKQVKRLEAMGLKAYMATELEFFLFDQTYDDARESGYRDLRLCSGYNEDYHIFQTSKEEDVMRAIRNGLYGAGITVENSKGEASAGQEEINVKYDEAVVTADQHAIVKNGAKEIAWARGKAITFLAKWSNAAAGSSSHIHQSLWSLDGKPMFYDPNGRYGMSKMMEHYVAGLLAHAEEMTYFLAPYINSYKRFVAGTFAPTKAIWSKDNRTAGYRLCGEGSKSIRIECRVGGSTSTPISPSQPFWLPDRRHRKADAARRSLHRAMLTRPAKSARCRRRCAPRRMRSTSRSFSVRPSAMAWSITMSVRRSGSRRNTTARSPIGKWRAGFERA